jgi:hypothetical protein
MNFVFYFLNSDKKVVNGNEETKESFACVMHFFLFGTTTTTMTHEEVINLARYPKLSFSSSLFVNGDLLNGWGKGGNAGYP